MRTAVVGFVVFAAAQSLGLGQVITTPIIRDVRPVTFPAYDRYPGIARYAPTPAEYTRAIGDRAFVMERLTYRSDDLEVYAYLYRPAAAPVRARLPVVVYNRGGWVRDDFSPEVLMLANRISHQGYLVIAPMLRGSGGAAGRDEMGGEDVDDVMNIVGVIKEIPYADSDRVFLYGESRGGIMSLLAVKANFPARAAAVWGTITDLDAYSAEDPAARQLAPTIWPGFPANESEIVATRSAMRWPDQINIPLLLMHGAADTQVSPVHSLQLAGALQKLGKRYELKIFYGENHISTARASERDDEAVKWFRRFDR